MSKKYFSSSEKVSSSFKVVSKAYRPCNLTDK